MCACVVMMVAAISGAASIDPQNPKSTSQDENPSRKNPLLPSEKDNSGIAPKRPKSRQVSSRYMSPSPCTSTVSSSISLTSNSSKRCLSPLVSRNSTPLSNGRSVSVDRRRPLPSRPDLTSKVGNKNEMSSATKLLVTSTRSLSVSFQGEAYSFPVSKTKAVPPPSQNSSSVRKGTPERRRSGTPVKGGKFNGDVVDHHVENKPMDQHRWPARIRLSNPSSRSFDYSNEDKKRSIGSDKVIRVLQQSMADEGRRASFDGKLGLNLGNAEPPKVREQGPDRSSITDLSASDSDSVSSGGTSGVQDSSRGVRRRGTITQDIALSARFWQETNSRLRRLQDPGSPLLSSPAKLAIPPRFGESKKYPSNGVSSCPRTMLSPVRGGIRPSSPSKLMTSSTVSSPSRGMPSPSRVRNSLSGIGVGVSLSETPSVFCIDVRRGKVGENQIVNAHLLRLLYNRRLQWQLVNARTKAALMAQKHSVEKKLWNSWITISDLRDSVTKKRYRLQLLRQKLKLASILKRQITCLEDWTSLEKDYSVSLVGAIEALRASTLLLPVVEGTTADVQNVGDAVGSAVDVMHALASSICLLSSKAEEMNSLVVELAKVMAKENASLEQCKGLLFMSTSMQVKNCSLRTHILQHNRVPAA